MQHGTGWNPELEAQHQSALDMLIQPLCAVSDGEVAEMPQRIDVRDKIKTNDQGPYNTCCGNAVDAVLQNDHLLSTGIVVNTSARFCYLAARMKDAAAQGRQVDWNDAGASISGGILATREFGAVLESDFPYFKFDWQSGTREDFDPNIPAAVRAKALDHRAQSVTPMVWNWESMLPNIGTGQVGGYAFGIWWTNDLANYRGGSPITKYRASGNSGHAICVYEYEWVNGERWPRVRNSHLNWGDNGTAVIAPPTFDAMLKAAPFGARGTSKMPAFVKRKIDLIRKAMR